MKSLFEKCFERSAHKNIVLNSHLPFVNAYYVTEQDVILKVVKPNIYRLDCGKWVPAQQFMELWYDSMDNFVDIDEETVIELRLGNIPLDGESFFDNDVVNHAETRCRICGNPIHPLQAFCECCGSKNSCTDGSHLFRWRETAIYEKDEKGLVRDIRKMELVCKYCGYSATSPEEADKVGRIETE